MLNEIIKESRRQVEICNACRYCEGYCSVFPAISQKMDFSDEDILQLANLCHNCRGCYYACQYTDPHEFSLNIPKVFAEVRHESWKEYAWPRVFSKLFESSSFAVVSALVLLFSVLLLLASNLQTSAGQGFYEYMSHGLMVSIFLPAFLIPLLSICISVRRFWRATGEGSLKIRDIISSIKSAGKLQDLSGGHGRGCNYENEDEYSNLRRYYHQFTFYGFLLCFASTSSGTILHYVFGMEAPYPFWSLPKLLGVPGGITLCIGTAGLAWLKTKADRNLSVQKLWKSEMAFIILLFFVSATGLLLYICTDTNFVTILLPLHLGTVLTFFLLAPYTKMIHGFYRMAALIRDSAQKNVKT